ncbi:hypothetical protein BJY01DRAFT_252849 [Aspergillus pseudoustus]|uniref:NAD(P)-binding protein n=1 Tax=Aspergillus pseudoustus TaxID=1810923 RepID=A0ABR4J461_9EURO
MASNADRNLFVKGIAFTKKNYRDLYPAIRPTRPEHSQAGNVVVITGASRGLGQLGFAASFAHANAKAVVLLARSNDGLVDTERIIKAIDPDTQVYSIAVDITEWASVIEAFDKTVARFGVPHVLVNNAGALASLASTAETDVESWWKTQEVNVIGSFLVTKAFLMKTGVTPSAPTTIINLTSGAAMGLVPGMGSYAITKLAVTKFTAYLHAEHPTITSVSLDPEIVATDMGNSIPLTVS